MREGDIRQTAAKEMEKSEIVLKNREQMSIIGALEVLSFDDEGARVKTVDGDLYVEGREIKIGALDTEKGIVILSGRINALYYATEQSKEKKGFLGRIMR